MSEQMKQYIVVEFNRYDAFNSTSKVVNATSPTEALYAVVSEEDLVYDDITEHKDGKRAGVDFEEMSYFSQELSI